MSPVSSGEHRGLGGTAALDGGLARPALGECGDVLGQPIDVEDMGIEVVREPFFEFAMALVVGIGDGLEEFGIAPGTADVLGRAAALGFDQAWVKDAGLGIDQAFDLDALFLSIGTAMMVRAPASLAICGPLKPGGTSSK